MTLKSLMSSLKVKLPSRFRYLFIYSSVSKVVTVMIDLLLRLNVGFQTGNKESDWVSHTYCCIQTHILSVSPPVVAVTGGTTIIQPSVVKTESDVMRTVKEPRVSSDTLQQTCCHAKGQKKQPHTCTPEASSFTQLHATLSK